jgi:hypothetical protein
MIEANSISTGFPWRPESTTVLPLSEGRVKFSATSSARMTFVDSPNGSIK